MKNFNFIPDRAINSIKDDELNRYAFAKQLKESLSTWEDPESLVISLRGEWGEGKTSVLNLLKEQFKDGKQETDPTIIEFNPWAYSNKDALTYHFFNDISGELKIRKEESNDKVLAEKLRIYSQLINLDKESTLIKDFIPKIITFIALFGIVSGKIIEWINLNPKWIGGFIFFFSLILLITELFSGLLNKIALGIDLKSTSKTVTPQNLKKEIIEDLTLRKKKLLIIIDDIDRLSQKEICEIFKLIRVNADFPNTIYLLAFDNKIIEANLKDQKGISGKDYLKKIVQVDFNLPYTKSDKIQQFLFKELDKLLNRLPDSINKYFNSGDNYWVNTYHSGYKNFFKNIRDVKRYINSLLFNINLLYRENVFEVNPIDFIALESLRVFTPEFYDFIKIRKDLFTDPVNSNNYTGQTTEGRKKEINEGFKLVEDYMQEDVKKLIIHLFPNLDPILKEIGGMHYASDFYISWRKELRICSKDNFDAYFTMNPSENEGELTQYDINKFLSTLNNNVDETEDFLLQYLNSKRIRPLLRRLQDYTQDFNTITQAGEFNLMLALNNVSDKIPNDKEGMFDIGMDMEIARIYYQLLSRENKNTNFDTLKSLIEKSNGISAILQTISLQSSRLEKDKNKPDDSKDLFDKNDLLELQRAIVHKIEQMPVDFLLSSENFLYIINRWKDWGSNEKLENFIHEIKLNNSRFIKFLKHFISTSKSISVGSYGIRTYKQVAFNNLSRFIDINEVLSFLDSINPTTEDYKELGDFLSMFKRDIDRYIKNPDGYNNFDHD